MIGVLISQAAAVAALAAVLVIPIRELIHQTKETHQ